VAEVADSVGVVPLASFAATSGFVESAAAPHSAMILHRR
jgi:hypothetical protein